MTSPSDSEYKSTKLIKQGKEILNEDFSLLAKWIDEKYGVKTFNIVYDEAAVDKRPRLQIIFEFEEEENLFWAPYGFEKSKQQEVAEQFTQMQKDKSRGIFNFLFAKKHQKYKTENIWIAFSSFMKCARMEIIWNISESDIKNLEEKLSLPELWKIYPETQGTTFFFYTSTQVKLFSENGVKEFITNEYFNLLKQYDDFNYFKASDFPIIFESKENFEVEYEGNLFRYSRR
jgi:hypothetical protein